MGQVPQWYRVVRAALFLGVAPWDLADRPMYWVLVAEAAQDAENSAAKQRETHSGKR